MALIRCPKCNAEISSKAYKCHNCGSIFNQRSSAKSEYLTSLIVLGVMMGGIALMAFLVSFLVDSNNSASLQARTRAIKAAVQSLSDGQDTTATLESRQNEIELTALVTELLSDDLESVLIEDARMTITLRSPQGGLSRPAEQADLVMAQNLRHVSEKVFTDERFKDLHEITFNDSSGETGPPCRMTRSLAEQINWANMNNDRLVQLMRDLGRLWSANDRREAALPTPSSQP